MDRQTSKQVTRTASHLRMLQADFAEDDQVPRQAHLRDTIQRALNQVTPSQRIAFLERLLLKFPAWDGESLKCQVGGPSAGRSKQDQRDLDDPAFLGQRLADLAPSMSSDQKRGLRQQLRQAGLIDDPVETWSEAAMERFRSAMEMKHEPSIQADRLLDLVPVLVGFVVSLEQVSWATWRAVAPRSSMRQATAIDRTIDQFLSGDAQVTHRQISQDLEHLRRLTASLILALGRTSEQFAHDFLARLSPDHIQALVPKRILSMCQEMLYWRKYKQLTENLSDTAIEKDVKHAIAQFVQSLMVGVD